MLISCNGLPEPSKLISNRTKDVHLFHYFSRQGDGLQNTKSAMEREKRYPTKDFHMGKLIKAELTRQGRSILGWPSRWAARARIYTRCFATSGSTPTFFSKSAKPWITTSSSYAPIITKQKNVKKPTNNLVAIFQYFGTNSTT